LSYIIVNLSILYASNISAQWITGKIDTITHNKSINYAVSPNSIAIDNQNTIHVVWQKREIESVPESWRVYYSRKIVNGNWSSPVPISDTLQKSVYPSIVVANKLRKLFVTYVKSLNNFVSRIAVAVADEKLKWQSINLTNDSVQNTWPSIAIDKNENIHVAWLGFDSLFLNKIKYSNNKNGVWKTLTLNDSFVGDNYYAVPSLSISPLGKVNILYLSIVGGQPRNVYAENENLGTEWNFELLPASINGSGILKISKKGKLNYIFNYSKDFQFPVHVYYTSKESKLSEWTSPELIPEFDGVCTSVELDDDDFMHLSLDSLELAFKTGKVYYATNRSGFWRSSPVSNKGLTYFSSFKLDIKGFGHVISSNQLTFNSSELVHFMSENSLTGIKNNSTNYLEDYNLFQNYPNPFNSYTVIEFSIPKSQRVKITIYNVLGEEIRILTKENFGSGIHKINFDSAYLSSGIYFYKIETKFFSSAKKMLLIK